MADRKDTKDRIKELLSKGYTKIQAIRSLRDEGYSPEEVDNAMDDVLAENFSPPEEEEPQQEINAKEPAGKKETSEKHMPKPPSPRHNKDEREIASLRKKLSILSRKEDKKIDSVKKHEIDDVLNFQVKLEKMHEEIKEDFKEATEQMEEFRATMKEFERRMEEIRKVEDDIKKLDLKQIRREIEILKTKEHWIVDNLERVDIEPVLDKINEVEHKIDRLKATSPFVIE